MAFKRKDKLTSDQISTDMKNLVARRGWKVMEEYLNERMESIAKDIVLKRMIINGTAHVLTEKQADLKRKEIADIRRLLALPHNLVNPEVTAPSDDIDEDDIDDIMGDVLSY